MIILKIFNKLIFFIPNINTETLVQWPHKFKLEYTVTLFNDNTLKCSLCVRNLGIESFKVQTLLHNYFKVTVMILLDVSNVT